MKKIFAILIAIFASAAQAESYFLDGLELTGGAYDLSAPVVNSRAALADSVAGQIVYDQTAGGFFGLPVGVSPTTAGNWVQLSTPGGTNAVTSAGTERIERLKVNVTGASTGSIVDQSGSWVTGITVASTQATINIDSGVFSSTPTCTCSGENSIGRLCEFTSASTSSAIEVGLVRSDTHAVSTGPINVICMGPR